MWHPNKNNEIFPGRPMGPFKSQGPHDKNIMVPALSDVSDGDHLSDSSRKRKSVAVDYPGNSIPSNSQSILGSHWRNDSKHINAFPVLSNMHEHGIDNTMRGFSKPVPSLESDVNEFHPRRYQSQGYPLAPQINEKNFPSTQHGAGKMDNLHPSTQQQAFHPKGQSSSINIAAVNIPSSPDPQALSNIISLIEAYKHAYPDASGTSLEQAFSALGSLGLNIGNITHILKGNTAMDLSTTTSEFSRSSEVSQINKMSNHDVQFDERLLVEDTLETAPSSEMKQIGLTLEVGRNMGVSAGGMNSLDTERREGNLKAQPFPYHNSEVIDNGATSELKLRYKNNGNHDAQITEGDERISVENECTSSGEFVAYKLDGESKLLAENVSMITEKLWDGSIHLSASMTVSAVAFFKSGEKAPETSWSKSIVLKGKVRLEAFERFIQELPRARSRGLMVTSLCWRAGSSTTGLAGMKAVAKVYKEQEKVGYATLNRGIDLYVCPRSDAIITILAKHGFFKGMAALEEDQDSFIGCVVWRKNHSSSDSGPKKSKRKTAPSPEQTTSQSENNTFENNPAPVDVAESKTTVSVSVNAGPEKPFNGGLEPPGPVKDDDDKDDDLPEFDFGVACGTTQNSVTAPVPSTPPAPQSTVSSSENAPEKIRKSLWDDGDDMPEWSPPDLDHWGGPKKMSTPKPPNPKPEEKSPSPSPQPPPQRPSVPGPPPITATSKPSFTYITTSVPNRKPENSHVPPPPPPRPLVPSPPPPPPQTQGFPYSMNPSQQPRPPGGQTPSSGFTFLSAPRPPGWRGL